jgi:beta-phosphoglucomutase-like phosphatase (HAD superfamily)
VKSADCVVVEDSPLGVAAANAAGMTVFGYAAMTDPAKLATADAIFHQMTALPALIEAA